MFFRSPFTLILAALTVSAKYLRFAGVNIARFDFGCSTNGTCKAQPTCPPLTQLGCADGLGQTQHFVKDDGYNLIRLPMTGVLNDTQFAKYVMLVEACLSTGAHCLIDLHIYARYDGQIVGQGGPSNEIFAELWGNIALYWRHESRIIFGLMNEPHDIPDVGTWAETVQAAVTAIRSMGAISQMILLSGTNYTAASSFVSSGSAEALNKVKNPDGSITKLIMDVHKYLDYDNSGTHVEGVANNIDNAWAPLSAWLRANGRQALHTETGGGNVESCVTYLQQQIAYQAKNSDVILGYVGWAAGSFSTNYILSETPQNSGSVWQDRLTVAEALSPRKNKLIG